MELPPGINCSAQGLIPGIVWYAESLVSFWFSLICKDEPEISFGIFETQFFHWQLTLFKGCI